MNDLEEFFRPNGAVHELIDLIGLMWPVSVGSR